MVDDALEGVEYRQLLQPLLEQLPPREKNIFSSAAVLRLPQHFRCVPSTEERALKARSISAQGNTLGRPAYSALAP